MFLDAKGDVCHTDVPHHAPASPAARKADAGRRRGLEKASSRFPGWGERYTPETSIGAGARGGKAVGKTGTVTTKGRGNTPCTGLGPSGTPVSTPGCSVQLDAWRPERKENSGIQFLSAQLCDYSNKPEVWGCTGPSVSSARFLDDLQM